MKCVEGSQVVVQTHYHYGYVTERGKDTINRLEEGEILECLDNPFNASYKLYRVKLKNGDVINVYESQIQGIFPEKNVVIEIEVDTDIVFKRYLEYMLDTIADSIYREGNSRIQNNEIITKFDYYKFLESIGNGFYSNVTLGWIKTILSNEQMSLLESAKDKECMIEIYNKGKLMIRLSGNELVL